MGPLRTTISCAIVATALFTVATRPAALRAESAQATARFESRWKLTLPGGPSAPAAYDAAHAYVPLRGGKLTAIALTDGHTDWTVDAPTTLRPATGQLLVFVAGEKEILALNVADGHVRWRISLEGSATVSPLFDTGWLFVGTDTGHLVALRAIDGQILWRLDAGASLSASPAPSGDSIYVPLSDGRIIAADVRTGMALWTRKLPGSPAEILALDDRLFVGSDDNYFYCIALKNGTIKWKWRTGADIVSAPVVDRTHVYFMSLDNVLRALDRRTGAQRWQHAVISRTVGGPLRSGSLIVVATVSPQLQAYRGANGTLAVSSPAPEGDELSSTLAGPPHLVSVDGRDAFVLLTRQGAVQFFALMS